MIEKISKMISNLKVLSKMNDIIDGLNTHTTNTNNPHNVTAEQLGLATAYVYKGSVENFSELPTNAQNGWVYSVENEYIDSSGNVHPTGSNFAWNGSRWDDLGGSLSRYTTLDFLEDRLTPITNQVNTNKTNIEDLQNEVDTLNTETIPIAVNKAEAAATNAQNAANEVREIYEDGNFTPLSDLLGGLGTKLKRWGSIFANKVFASNLPIVYNSVAEMKADTMLWEGMNTKTLGYYTPNDGGSASYLIRAKADTDVDDGGSIHELSNGLVAELIVENGTVNVKQFGAVGDGIIDDAVAINSAIAFSDNYSYKVIFPYNNEFAVAKAILCKKSDLIMDSPLVELTTDEPFPCLIIGDESNRLYQKKYYLWTKCKDRMSMDLAPIGILMYNISNSEITIKYTEKFGCGAKMIAKNSNSFVTNTVFLGHFKDCQNGIILKSENAGWINDNTFIKGYFEISSAFQNDINAEDIVIDSDGEYVNINSNVFYSPSFEGNGKTLPIHIIHGTNNKFLYCRNENTNKSAIVVCENRSVNNYVSLSYSVASSSSANVVNKGVLAGNMCGENYFHILQDINIFTDCLSENNAITAQKGGFFNPRGNAFEKSNPTDYVKLNTNGLTSLSNNSPLVIFGTFVKTNKCKRFKINATGELNNSYFAVLCYDSNSNILLGDRELGDDFNYQFNVKFGPTLQTPVITSNLFHRSGETIVSGRELDIELSPDVDSAIIGIWIYPEDYIRRISTQSYSDGYSKENHIPEILA